MAQSVAVQKLIALLTERSNEINDPDFPDSLTPNTMVDTHRCGHVVISAFRLTSLNLDPKMMRISTLAGRIPETSLDNYTPPRPHRYALSA